MRAIQSDLSRAGCRPVPVAIYTRVSTINQVGGRFDSCERQASICREFLRKHAAEGWYEAASFSDPAYSGGSMNRPGFQALKRQIEAGDIKVVLIFKLERVLRSTDEWTPLRAFLQKHGCRLVSPSEDLSDDTASGRLKNNLLVSVAEYERLNTAEKVRARAVALLGPALAGPLWPALSAETAQAVSVSHPDDMKPNMTRRITVVIHDQTLLCYQAAARQLQRRLGEAAPSVEELIAYELTSKRTVKSIMDEYRDSQRRARR